MSIIKGTCKGCLPTKNNSEAKEKRTMLVAAYKLRLNREIISMKTNDAKVNCEKLINAYDIPVSSFAVVRYLKKQGMIYKKFATEEIIRSEIRIHLSSEASEKVGVL